MLAGLVHDLGHGPFSHMWEDFIHRHARQLPDSDARKERLLDWTHESMCEHLLDCLLSSNEIDLGKYFRGDPEEQRRCVLKLVSGVRPDEQLPEGRERKRFLFDIVANKRNGVDVDKLDYLVRDVMNAKGGVSFDAERIIAASRVIHDEVCFEEKVLHDICKVYQLRTEGHRTMYQHRVTKVAEAMVTDLLEAAERAEFRFRGADGRAVSLVDAVLDPPSYARLTDGVLHEIGGQLDPAHRGNGLVHELLGHAQRGV